MSLPFSRSSVYSLQFWQLVLIAMLALLLTFLTSFLVMTALNAKIMLVVSAILFVSPGLLLGLGANFLFQSAGLFVSLSFVGNICYLYALVLLYRYLKELASKEQIVSSWGIVLTISLYYFSVLGIIILSIFLKGEL